MRHALWLITAIMLVTPTVLSAAPAAPAEAATGAPPVSYGDLGTLDTLTEATARAVLADDARLEGVTLAFDGVREGLALSHARFHQTAAGLPVEGTRAQVSVDALGVVRWTIADVQPDVEAAPCHGFDEDAVSAARAELPGNLWAPPRAEHLVTHAGETVWRVNLLPKEPLGSWMVDVSCQGDVLRVWDAARYLRGSGHSATGEVFPVSPIVAAGDPDMRDNAAGAGLGMDDLLMEVELLGLDDSGTLSGEYAYMVTPHAVEADGTFVYDRADPRYEEVGAYYYTDWAQRHIQSLGFDDIHNRTTATVPRVPGAYTAFYTGNPDAEIFYGYHGVPATLLYGPEHLTTGAGVTGLADAAEDAHVIFHEYGHAVLDDQAGICCTEESAAMHEAFGDWQAASLSSRFHDVAAADGCMAPWFGSYLQPEADGEWPCYRNLVNDDTMDDWEEGDDAHFNQLIWSGALWAIETGMMEDMGREEGAAAFEKLMYEANFLLPQRATFAAGALALLQADAVQTGGAFHDRVAGEMVHRKILDDGEVPTVAELLGEDGGGALTPTSDDGGAEGDGTLSVPGAATMVSLVALASAALARRRR